MLFIRNTTSTTFDISNLEPCSTYTVGVSSFNFFLVPGEAANVTHTTSSEYLCNINYLSISLLFSCLKIYNQHQIKRRKVFTTRTTEA